MEGNKSKVLITGISGYLGSQVCKHFLEDSTFAVRGTVRDKQNEKKMQLLRTAFHELFPLIELFEANLLNAESIE